MTDDAAALPGVLVAIEGCDGAGKSTIAPLVAAGLRARGHPVRSLHPKNPDLSALPEYLRAHLGQLQRLLWREQGHEEERNLLPDAHWITLSGSWFAAVDDLVVRPALHEGGIVLLDSWSTKLEVRFSLKGPAFAEHAANVYRPITRPRIGVLLDVDPVVAAARKSTFGLSECGHFDGLRGRGPENFVAYQSRVRSALLDRAAADRWAVVATDSPGDAVADRVIAMIEASLPTPAAT
ncbi:dTMP kinase [Spirillospora sp. NPDC050679]